MLSLILQANKHAVDFAYCYFNVTRFYAINAILTARGPSYTFFLLCTRKHFLGHSFMSRHACRCKFYHRTELGKSRLT